jgi:hypothetical protein
MRVVASPSPQSTVFYGAVVRGTVRAVELPLSLSLNILFTFPMVGAVCCDASTCHPSYLHHCLFVAAFLFFFLCSSPYLFGRPRVFVRLCVTVCMCMFASELLLVVEGVALFISFISISACAS